MTNTFHDGEKKIQEMAGEQSAANSNGRMIASSIIRGAINFIEKQSMVILSTVDENQNVWTSIMIGDYGFVKVLDSETLSIDLDKVHSDQDDVFYENVKANPAVGTLFIELSTRRRFRINGSATVANGTIEIAVAESYPNCPQYIQQRLISRPEAFDSVQASRFEGNTLTTELMEWIKTADTIFVGSQSNEGRMDASHRGGNPGFVKIVDDNTIRIPDYKGNGLFNTLGNISQNPNTGLLLVDFEGKRTLQLIGTAQVFFDQSSGGDVSKAGDTGRYWDFKVSAWILTVDHHQVDWEFMSYSPYNPE